MKAIFNYFDLFFLILFANHCIIQNSFKHIHKAEMSIICIHRKEKGIQILGARPQKIIICKKKSTFEKYLAV